MIDFWRLVGGCALDGSFFSGLMDRTAKGAGYSNLGDLRGYLIDQGFGRISAWQVVEVNYMFTKSQPDRVHLADFLETIREEWGDGASDDTDRESRAVVGLASLERSFMDRWLNASEPDPADVTGLRTLFEESSPTFILTTPDLRSLNKLIRSDEVRDAMIQFGRHAWDSPACPSMHDPSSNYEHCVVELLQEYLDQHPDMRNDLVQRGALRT